MKSAIDKNHAWQTALIEAVTQPEELFRRLNLDPELLPSSLQAVRDFSLKVPQSFINRMEKGNPDDPLLLQVLPQIAELLDIPGYVKDPLHEKKFNPVPGLLHKYHGRVLLMLTGTCGINCRYCFRRHFNYEDNNPGSLGWTRVLNYIAEKKDIHEVILSGGDPLVSNDATLQKITMQLTALPHIKRLRIHSRLPIVLPERITPEFIHAITAPSLKTVLVVHCNHPREINQEVKEKIHLLKENNITLLNQSVLLKGINDQIDILCQLSETLFDIGIQPYYLHLLDKVQGASHFDLDLQTARHLYSEMTTRLSGYLIPKLVCEQHDKPAKTTMNYDVFFTE